MNKINKIRKYLAVNGSEKTIEKYEKTVLKSKDPMLSYWFCKSVKGANVKEHGKIVIESKDLPVNYWFAMDVSGAEVNEHGKVILQSQNMYYIGLFFSYVKNIDKQKYIEFLFEVKERINKKLNVEQTFAIIKPDGIKNIEKIIEMIYSSGLSINKYETKKLDKEILKEHYSHLLNEPFYPRLENYMLSSDVVIMILEGENAVEKLRNLMGPTDSKKAPKGTIRGEFGTDITYNVIHGSDSKENAEIEINRFFKKQKVLEKKI